MVSTQQYPCPAFLFFFPDFHIVSRAAVPEERCPVECRVYFVRPSVCRSSVSPTICSSEEALACGLRPEALVWGPWLGRHGLEALALAWRPGGLEALAWRPWSGGPGLRPLIWGPWPGGPGLGALAWGPWPGGPDLGALGWGPWLGGPGLGVLTWGP